MEIGFPQIVRKKPKQEEKVQKPQTVQGKVAFVFESG